MHGLLKGYRSGCRCLPCKAANADHVAKWRDAKRTGRRLLGARIRARETWALIRALLVEGFEKQELARLLGLKRPILDVHHTYVTVRTALKVRRLARRYLGDHLKFLKLDTDGPRR